MRRLSNAFKNRVSSVKSDTSVLSDSGEFPTPADLFRYRKQRGVNLGAYNASSARMRGPHSPQSPCRVLVRTRTLDHRHAVPAGQVSRAKRLGRRARPECQGSAGATLGFVDHREGLRVDCRARIEFCPSPGMCIHAIDVRTLNWRADWLLSPERSRSVCIGRDRFRRFRQCVPRSLAEDHQRARLGEQLWVGRVDWYVS